jgi:hypothetical protein
MHLIPFKFINIFALISAQQCFANSFFKAHVTGTNFRGQPVIVFTPSSQAKYDQVSLLFRCVCLLLMIMRCRSWNGFLRELTAP